jgi:hypothetical protein
MAAKPKSSFCPRTRECVCGVTFNPKRKKSLGCSPAHQAAIRKRRQRATSPNPQERLRAQALARYGEKCMHCPPRRGPTRVVAVSPDRSMSVDGALVLCVRHAHRAHREYRYGRTWKKRVRPRLPAFRFSSSDGSQVFARIGGGQVAFDIYFADDTEMRHTALGDDGAYLP